MRPILVLLAALVPTIALALAAPDVRAATTAVSIGDGSFGPAAITVTVGDTVTWTNDDDSPHTVTADGGAFDSGNLEPGQTFSFTFSEPGTFAYACQYHDEMVGTITVVAAAGAAATATAQPASAAPSATAGDAGGVAGDQPDTALPVPAGAGWMATLLIGLGLVVLAFALVPPRMLARSRSASSAGGWRR